jgi:hypothetical protein
MERNSSNGENAGGDGRTITLNGVTYAKGIGMHASADLTFNLGGQYTQFLSDVGIDDEAGTNGSAKFWVYLDGVLSYDSGVMTGSTATKSINLNTTGKSTLRLVLNNNGDDAWDHGDWADARLIVGTPVPVPATPTGLTTAVVNQQIELDWIDNATDETGYRVERKAGSNGTWIQIAQLGVDSHGYSDTSAGAGVTYYYRVYSYNNGGPSGFSNEATATLPVPPGTTYISDITWASSTNGWGQAERDQSNGETASGDGRTITLNGATYAKGVGMHASGELVVDLNGQYQRFQSDIGVDDEAGSNGSVNFQVWLDGVLVYDSGLMTGNSATKSIDLSVAGKNTLRLVLTDGGNGNGWDHADWAGARLLN